MRYNDKTLRKIARLADKYPFIERNITEHGLSLIAKYRQSAQRPWWRRLIQFVQRVR